MLSFYKEKSFFGQVLLIYTAWLIVAFTANIFLPIADLRADFNSLDIYTYIKSCSELSQFSIQMTLVHIVFLFFLIIKTIKSHPILRRENIISYKRSKVFILSMSQFLFGSIIFWALYIEFPSRFSECSVNKEGLLKMFYMQLINTEISFSVATYVVFVLIVNSLILGVLLFQTFLGYKKLSKGNI